jgi:hypothetical protein
MKLIGRILGYLWLGALGFILCYSALITDRRTQQVEEFPFGCDSFGYLQMAQDIRLAAAVPAWPKFYRDSSHIRALVELMRSKNVPVQNWEEVVGPHAHHYFPRSDFVGVQYPPGTGLLLAIFPEGQALHGLDRMVIASFVVVGVLVLVIAAIKQAWLSAGLVILALQLGFEILGRIGNASFSINAMLAPLLLSILCLFLALRFRQQKDRAPFFAWTIIFLAGLFFGLAVLVRLPILFLLPGVVVLLWPRELRDWRRNLLLPFVAGAFLSGFFPLAVFQSRLVGAWYLPTYGRSDAAPPTLDVLKTNISFYLGGGDGSTDNWALLVVALCSLALLWWFGNVKGNAEQATAFSRRRLLLSALLMWATSTAYFLTHKIAIHFYAIPCAFAVVVLLALGTFSLETMRETRRRWKAFPAFGLLLIMIAPGIIAGFSAWRNYLPYEAETKPRTFVLPTELADEHAWIWSDSLTGTLWYYNRKPAHKIQFTGRETRALIFQFVHGRGEPQYLIHDDEGMQGLEDEIASLGGKLEKKGEVDGHPYLLIHWPPDGPQTTVATAVTGARK